ncbi:hypothetical protein scyTo_0009255 [Scyliorhinus torazame]|uniref:ATP synthase F(0) complex subunit e, mitochondrial n=1 Tax=Scyliorhinus torazame TaxID=75743 RepID=A0A401NJ57_SCYTO|nr:hypothetical protein [Scyliorhinus torazame]
MARYSALLVSILHRKTRCEYLKSIAEEERRVEAEEKKKEEELERIEKQLTEADDAILKRLPLKSDEESTCCLLGLLYEDSDDEYEDIDDEYDDINYDDEDTYEECEYDDEIYNSESKSVEGDEKALVRWF